MSTIPTLDDVRDWVAVPVTLIDDVTLQAVLDTEIDLQARRCLIPTDPDAFPPALVQALYRRVARELAAKGLPLGLMTDPEYGTAVRLPGSDVEMNRLEAPYRVTAIA